MLTSHKDGKPWVMRARSQYKQHRQLARCRI
ncbi:class I SAM-dependent methyltransferase family protein [Escherichia coli]